MHEGITNQVGLAEGCTKGAGAAGTTEGGCSAGGPPSAIVV